ncbi:hypothetical protein THAOC_19680 [Thalassiosira oceanica]|uniref:Uncharacterized protein n=1 Tax=Thalassiosira oceanica TaxID=159749 RepID=K0S1R8_THAOC|nr:hypothetical protein THAOC_19680 [Thalassiosira oceanica]|eukprot:EJK60038.1 hypothetical protein THAOC_19680 [Thalassiosira oceanica]
MEPICRGLRDDMKGRSTPAPVDGKAFGVSENTRRIEADLVGAAHRDALAVIQALSTKYSTDRLAERGNLGGHLVERGRAIWTHGRDRKATTDAGYASRRVTRVRRGGWADPYHIGKDNRRIWSRNSAQSS